MKPLLFASSNQHKFEEIQAVLRGFGLPLRQRKTELEENGSTLEEIAESKARQAYEKFRCPVLVEDTGVFLRDYRNFPGPWAKRVFLALGWKGLLRLAKGTSRKASFETVIGYRDRKEGKLFSGTWKGRIADRIFDRNKDVLPYEKIFIPTGFQKTLSSVSREEKNRLSHRAQAARKFASWFLHRKEEKR